MASLAREGNYFFEFSYEISSWLKFHLFLFIYSCHKTSQLVGEFIILSCHYFVNTAGNLHLLILLTFLRIFCFLFSLIITENEILGPL